MIQEEFAQYKKKMCNCDEKKYPTPEKKVRMIPLKKLNKQLEKNDFYDGPMPMEIDIVRSKNTFPDIQDKSLVAVNGRIKNKDFPILCDSCSNISVMPIEIAKELGLEIIAERNHDLSGMATEKKTVGMVYDVHITLAPGCTIIEDFVVIEGYEYQEVLLSRPTLKHRYNYDLFESREHLVITCNEKNYFIPFIELQRND